jgi:hypothetical protein
VCGGELRPEGVRAFAWEIERDARARETIWVPVLMVSGLQLPTYGCVGIAALRRQAAWTARLALEVSVDSFSVPL